MPTSGTIGVCGVAANAGVTHLCIALANFLCSKFYSNTAYLELNGSHEICALAGKQNPNKPFTHQRITYYPNLTLAQLPVILSKRYKHYVLDFGRPNQYTIQAFLRCDIRLVIGPVSPWKQAQYQKFVQETFHISAKEEVCYIGGYLGCCMEHIKDSGQFLRNYGISVIPVPFLPNPFRIASKDFAFFEKILGGN